MVVETFASDIGWIVGHSYNVYGPLLVGWLSDRLATQYGAGDGLAWAMAAVAAQDPLPRLQRLPVGTSLPRTAIYHGGQDNNVLPQANAVALADALRRAGADVTLELFPEADHFVLEMGQPIQDRLAAFFGDAL